MGILIGPTFAFGTRTYSACPPGMPPYRWLKPNSAAPERRLFLFMMEPRSGLVVSHAENSCMSQKKQLPQAITNGTTTRSPFCSLVTLGPASTTSPMNSWPRMSPLFIAGIFPRYMCRSEPQIAVAVTFRMTSSGSCRIGSGTVSTLTSWLPW